MNALHHHGVPSGGWTSYDPLHVIVLSTLKHAINDVMFNIQFRDGDQDQMPTYNSGSLTVELRPLTSSSWLKVQRNSINPRLR